MSGITIVNFSHPITKPQQESIEAMTGLSVTRLIEVPVDFDHQDSFLDQVQVLIDAVDVSWEIDQLIVNLPALSSIAAVTLARLHGLMGHFPTIVRIAPVPNATIPRFEVAEIINLNDLRIRAAALRQESNITEDRR